MLGRLEKQIHDHQDGVKVLEDARLSSLKNRVITYKKQLVDALEPLTDAVRTNMPVHVALLQSKYRADLCCRIPL